jgi:hypothetical protein
MYYYEPKNWYVTVDPAVWVKFTMPSNPVHAGLYCTAGSLPSTLTVEPSSWTLEDGMYWIWSNQKVCWCKTVTFTLSTWGPSRRSLWQRTQLFSASTPGGTSFQPMLILSTKHSQVGSWIPATFKLLAMLVPRTTTFDPEKRPKAKDSAIKQTNHHGHTTERIRKACIDIGAV